MPAEVARYPRQQIASLIGPIVIAFTLWITGLMVFMPGAQLHLKRGAAVLALGGVVVVVGWLLRRRRQSGYVMGLLAVAAATPAYFFFGPFLFHSEFIFALSVIAISALWGAAPGLLTALLATAGYAIVNAIGPSHPGALTESLAVGGFFVVSAVVVSVLTRQREAALLVRDRLADELERTYEATLGALVGALDARDQDTQGHSQRVTSLALAVARELGVDSDQLRWIRWGALLHDVGKIGIPDHILRKPGPLSDDEWAQMRQHPQIGHDMLYGIPFLRPALEIVLYHHERFDGSGYPNKLKADAIPLPARIFAVADTYDAICSNRPYRNGRSRDEAVEEIRRQAGKQFDPIMVRMFVRAINRR